MIHFNRDELEMLDHAANTMNDRILCEPDEYTRSDNSAIRKLFQTANTETSAIVITGEELDKQERIWAFRQVLDAELRHWVPNASQRLLTRAAAALEVEYPPGVGKSVDCGAEPGWHALIGDWLAGIYVRRCISCARVYRDGSTE